MKNTLKSAGAVLLGFVIIAVLSTITDTILENTGVIPKGQLPLQGGELMLSGIIAYRAIFSVIGCFVTAKLAPSHPVRHALILGGLGAILTLAGGFAMQGAAPLWFTLMLAVISLPLAWLGGNLARKAGKTA